MEPDQQITAPEFGRLLRDIRVRHDMTQAELSGDLTRVRGCSQAAISRLESGMWMPDAGQMEHILKAIYATESDVRAVRSAAAALRVRDA